MLTQIYFIVKNSLCPRVVDWVRVVEDIVRIVVVVNAGDAVVVDAGAQDDLGEGKQEDKGDEGEHDQQSTADE